MLEWVKMGKMGPAIPDHLLTALRTAYSIVNDKTLIPEILKDGSRKDASPKWLVYSENRFYQYAVVTYGVATLCRISEIEIDSGEDEYPLWPNKIPRGLIAWDKWFAQKAKALEALNLQIEALAHQ